MVRYFSSDIAAVAIGTSDLADSVLFAFYHNQPVFLLDFLPL
jgi:hypothetical protein